MLNKDNTKAQLVAELNELRQHVAQCERDKEDRKRAEDALRESARKYRELVEHANSIILRWTHDGQITFLNEFGQRFFGYSEAEILGRHVLGTIVPETESTGRDLRPLMDQICEDPLAFVHNVNENIRRNGERVWIAWTNKVDFDDQGRVVGILSIGADITERKRAEEALRRTEENFRRSLEESPLGVRIVTEKGETIYANRAILSVYGYDSIEDLKTTPAIKRYTPESYAEFQIRRAKRKQGVCDPSEYGISIVRKDGEVRHLQVVRKEILWDGERQFQVIYQDVTDRKQMEEALRASEIRYRIVADNTYDWEYWVSPEGRILYTSPSCRRITGYTASEFETDPDLLSHIIYPDDLTDFEAHLERDRIRSDPSELELRIICRDGTTKWVGHICQPVFDARGLFLGRRGSNRDITIRKKAEKALKESEDKFRNLFNNAGVAMFRSRIDGSAILDVNEKFLDLVGKNRAETQGTPSATFWAEPEKRDKMVQRLVAEGRLSDLELKILNKQGGVRDCITSLVLYREQGIVEGAIVDITERKQAEAARREVSHQRFQACNVVAHELRNVLIKIGFVFPAINSVMSFLREQWEFELRKVLPDQEDKNALLMRLGELLLMGQPYLGGRKALTRVSEELLAEQMVVANAFLLPKNGKAWLDNKIRPKWRRLLTECQTWDEYKDDVVRLLTRLENAILIAGDEELAEKMGHIPEDLRVQWPKLAYTEFSTANLSLLGDVLRLLEHPELNIKHKQQLSKLLTSLKALADITSLIEDRMNRMLLSLKSGEDLNED